MARCKYCKSDMMFQGNDKIGNEYCGLYVCSKCKTVYEKHTDLKGNFKSEEWWNPETEETDKK